MVTDACGNAENGLNDTHIVVMLAESIMEKGKLHLNDFAARLKKWGTENPADMTDFYHSLFANEDWAEHQKEVTHRIWKNNGVYRHRTKLCCVL